MCRCLNSLTLPLRTVSLSFFCLLFPSAFFCLPVRMRENKDQKKLRIWTLFAQWYLLHMFTFRNKRSWFSYKNQHGESIFWSKLFSLSHFLVMFLLITPWIHFKIVKHIIFKYNLKDQWLVELSHRLKNIPVLRYFVRLNFPKKSFYHVTRY